MTANYVKRSSTNTWVVKCPESGHLVDVFETCARCKYVWGIEGTTVLCGMETLNEIVMPEPPTDNIMEGAHETFQYDPAHNEFWCPVCKQWRNGEWLNPSATGTASCEFCGHEAQVVVEG